MLTIKTGAHRFNIKTVSPKIIHHMPSGRILVTSSTYYVLEVFLLFTPSMGSDL